MTRLSYADDSAGAISIPLLGEAARFRDVRRHNDARGEDDERGGDRAIARGPVAALGDAGVRFASARFVGAASRRARLGPRDSAGSLGRPRGRPVRAPRRSAPRVRPPRTLPSPRRARYARARTLRLRLSRSADAENPTGKLLVACGVGLLTGLGVAVFNIAEHGLHDLVFLTTASSPERYQLEGVRDVRPDTWLQAVGTVAAPTAAGFAVTGLRFLADGFDGEEKPRWPRERRGAGERGRLRDLPPDASDVLRSAAKPTLKAAAAVVTLGSGASLGPGGPSVGSARPSRAALPPRGRGRERERERGWGRGRRGRGRGRGRAISPPRRLLDVWDSSPPVLRLASRRVSARPSPVCSSRSSPSSSPRRVKETWNRAEAPVSDRSPPRA